MDHVYNLNARHDIAWCRSCSLWQHIPCCDAVKPDQVDLLARDFGQTYLLDTGLGSVEDSHFLLLIKSPIRRFSRQSGSPLSMEVLQAKAYQWLDQQPFHLNDNWLQTMINSGDGHRDVNKVIAHLEDIRLKISKCNWLICASCSRQLI